MDGNNSQSNLGSGDGTTITTGTNISIGDMSTTNNTFNINTNYQCYLEYGLLIRLILVRMNLWIRSFQHY